MAFTQLLPQAEARQLVSCYWFVDDDGTTPVEQKIVPDGYPEIIFHFGDPYEIKLRDTWSLQTRELLAGQLTRYFHLRNTGTSGIVGIKLQPTAIAHLFNCTMSDITDSVVNFRGTLPAAFAMLNPAIESYIFGRNKTVLAGQLDHLFTARSLLSRPLAVDAAVKQIIDSNGNLNVEEMCDANAISERQLERQFRRYVGLSPKFYARVIRFSYIFQLVNAPGFSWTDLSLEAGFYDQPHFSKDFKAFTGEEPSRYHFNEETLANFFMKRK
ncbi:MAG: AraC family transcriptional regulator [Bacteroidia bacterium]|nr:AraC family transcriptional regulator [Bacteroidia bacterium]